MKKTTMLKDLLSQHATTVTPEEFESFSAEIDQMIQDTMNELNELPELSQKAAKIHQHLDAQNELHSNTKISCAKGCGVCCHQEVEITAADAQQLAKAVIEQNISIDMTQLKNHAARKRLDEAWKKGPTPQNKCVFLDSTNSCGIYSARPAVCRKHMVVSHPTECGKIGGSPIARIIPMSEIYMSAFISLPEQTFGSLAKMLDEALSNQEVLITK